MLYVKKVIGMLRTVLHDLSVKICTGCDRSNQGLTPDALTIFVSISSDLKRIEADFARFIEICEEVNKCEKVNKDE